MPNDTVRKSGKASRILETIIGVFLVAVLAWCLLRAFRITANMEYTMDEVTYFTKDNLFRNLGWLMLLLIILAVANHLLRHVKPWILFTAGAVVLSVFLVYLIQQINLTPTWDAYRTYHAAVLFLQKDYSPLKSGGYIATYSFQIPLMLYDCLLILLFGPNYIVPQLVNIAFLIGVYWFLLRTVAIISDQNENAQRFCILFCMAFLPLSMYVMFLYSNIPSLFFACAGLYQGCCYLKEQRLRSLIQAFLWIGLSSLLKGTSYIALIALVLTVLMTLQKNHWKRPLLVSALAAAVIIALPAGLQKTVESASPEIHLEDSLYVPYALEMGAKRGLRGAGWHDGWMEVYLNTAYSTYEEKKNAADEIIRSNYKTLFQSPSYCYAFYRDKLNSIWANSEFQGFWTIQANKLDTAGKGDAPMQSFLWIRYDSSKDSYNAFTASYMSGALNKAIRGYLNAFQNLIYLLALTDVLKNLRRKALNRERLLLPLTFLGGFLFLIIWEAKAQYSILFFVLLFPAASIQAADWLEQLSQKIMRKPRG